MLRIKVPCIPCAKKGKDKKVNTRCMFIGAEMIIIQVQGCYACGWMRNVSKTIHRNS